MRNRRECCTIVAAAVLVCVLQGAGYAEMSSKARTQEKKSTAPVTWDFAAHYRTRVAQIEKQMARLAPTTTGTVVLLGDSITEGFNVHELGGLPVVNMGISVDQIAMPGGTGGVLDRVHLLAKARPAHIFLLIGINDFGSSKPLDVAKRQYADLVRAIRAAAPSATLHIQSVLPTRGHYAALNPTVRAMNAYLRELAQREGVDYVDLAAVMSDDRGELREGWTADGLHLLPPAYGAWRKAIEQRLAARAN